MIFGNGIFVAASTSGMYYSMDGVNWQSQYPQSIVPGGLAYVNGSFVILNNGGYGSYSLIKSTDGMNWTQSPTNLPMLTSAWGLYYESSLFPLYPPPALCPYKSTLLMGGFDGVLVQSASTTVPIATNSVRLNSAGFGFSFTPAVGNTFRAQASTNLNIWSNILSGIGTGQSTNFTDNSPAGYSARYFRVVSP